MSRMSSFHNTRSGISAAGWQRLTTALEYYTQNGYAYKDVPWMVGRETSLLTCPDRGRIMGVPHHGDLVGSAEQGFLELMRQRRPGVYVAITPCFRDEGTLDKLHGLTFMKVELYRDDNADNEALMDVITSAQSFMKQVLPPELENRLQLVQTESGFDLELKGIEVGSYGIRTLPSGEQYIYGTGLAEPRFEIAMNWKS